MYILTNIVLVVIFTTITIGQEVDESCVLTKSNISGTCKFAKDCPEVDRLTTQGEHVQLCGFYLSIRPIFCCPNTPSSVPSPTTPPPSVVDSIPWVVPSTMEPTVPAVDEATAINYNKRMCEEYSKNYTMVGFTTNLATNSQPVPNIGSNCEKNGINLVSSGNATVLKEFPFAAVLGTKLDNASISWFCGGSLISDRFVLTAAHCLTGNSVASIVRLGDYNLIDDTDGAMHRDYSIEQLIIHPQYANGIAYNDIALMKLTERVIFTDFIQPACLWPEPSKIIENSTIAIGWGSTNYDATPSDVLLKVGLKVYDNSLCQLYYSDEGNLKRFPMGVLSSMLCAGDTESEKDTCHGDSGGPLVKIDKDNSCIQYIVGITSLGKICGLVNSAAIYTRVTYYLGWIVHHLQKN